MLEEIVQLFNVLIKLLYYGVLISYSIGRCIVFIADILLRTAKTTFVYISQFLVLFYEEYANFFRDIVENTSFILSGISKVCVNGTLQLLNGGKSLLDGISTLLQSGNLKLANLGYGILYSLGWAVEMLKKLIILIGGGVWFLVTLLPNGTYNLIVFTYASTVLSINFIKALCYRSLVNVLASMEHMWDFFKDVPLQSLLGLLFIYTIYKKRQPVSHYSGRFLIKMYNVCRIVLTKVYIFLSRLHSSFRLRRLRTRQQPIDQLLNDSASPIRTNPSPSLRSHLNVPTSDTVSPIQRPSRRKPITRTNPISPSKKSSEDDSNLCIICQDARKSVVLFPCRHLCLCSGCSENLSRYRRECPLCRSPIFRQINVFL